jgi:hypothetical protein
VSRRTWGAGVLFAALLTAGTLLDPASEPAARSPRILEADLHVHPFPGDGVLSVAALQREAERRGLDVIAVTAHNNRFALDLAQALPQPASTVIVLPGQEITTPGFHLVAVGIERLVDWRLGAADAVAAVQRQGGVAIAAHPVPSSWRDADPAALASLDGAEVAHPGRSRPPDEDEYLGYFRRVQALKPGIAPIGSSDFHTAAPLGISRTYLLVVERSAEGVLEAIRRGRTVARGPRGELHGTAADIAAVEEYLAGRGVPTVPLAERLVALAALAALAGLVAPGLAARGGR